MPSTVISDFSYDPATSILRVVFQSGNIYDYANVPQEVYNEMKSSFSKGSFLNQHVKGNYSCTKVKSGASPKSHKSNKP